MRRSILKRLMKSEKKMIGSGQQAEVFSFSDMPNIAIKIARKKYSNDIEREYRTLKKIINCFSNRNILNIIFPYQIEYIDDKCHMLMDRLNSPDINIVFAHPSKNGGLVEKNKAGLEYMRRFFDPYEYIKELATFVAFLHYGLEYDASDLEFIIARKFGTEDPYKVYAIDFGLVTKVKDLDEKLKWYARAIITDSYPNAYSDRKLYKLFVSTYITTAKIYHMENFAENVIIMSIDIFITRLRKKNLI